MNNALLGLALFVAGSAATAEAAVAPAPPAVTVACAVELNVIDPDPKGLNVRAAPDAKSGKAGKVIAVLKPVGEWIQVHVVGQNGDWFRIDHAEAIDHDAENGERQVFHGDGWVHSSKLGISELYVGDGTIIRDRPAPEGAVLLRIDNPDKEPKATKVLGCEASYIKVDADKQIGGTRDFCTNERTTCS